MYPPQSQIPTVGNYVAMSLLAMIPLVGFILMIIWAVGGSGVPLWKSNYARAYFILVAIGFGIGIVLSILSTVVFAGLFSALFSGLGSFY
jgi:hypothetical protein